MVATALRAGRCLALLLTASLVLQATAGESSDQNATAATDAPNEPPPPRERKEHGDFCATFSRCKETAFRRYVHCSGGLVLMLLGEQNIAATPPELDTCGTDHSARCVDELTDELEPTLSGLHKQVRKGTAECIRSAELTEHRPPIDKSLKERCHGIRFNKDEEGGEEGEGKHDKNGDKNKEEEKRPNKPSKCKEIFEKAQKECAILEICCPEHNKCRQQMESDSELAKRGNQVGELYQKCLKSDHASVLFDRDPPNEASTEPSTQPTTASTPDKTPSPSSDSIIDVLNGTSNATKPHIPRGKEAIIAGTERRRAAMKEWSERVNVLAKEFYAKLKARHGNGTNATNSNTSSHRSHRSADAPSRHESSSHWPCKRLVRCESELEERRRKCWHKGGRQGPHYWYLLKRLFGERKTGDREEDGRDEKRREEHKKCTDCITDGETQGEIEVLHTVIQAQNHECVRSRKCYLSRVKSVADVNVAADHHKCRHRHGGDRSSDGDDSDESAESTERWNSRHYCDPERLRRLEHKCRKLRKCCPRLERCEEHNESREARKLRDIARRLRDEVDACENRRSNAGRIGESTYRKFNSAISPKIDGGVQWDDDAEVGVRESS